ncbi:MAG: 16S rRNA (adenine(1518)-N(6)/adenine(1519)-N(6))-dimethyltransferase RsmA [Candidatus Thalassarchaeaceae archaeon]|nr:16S rRNA (adenine(1518)-N(6)/adenine(1519)-N(6))-dimethyltransferase RsmA [Candidatus Thalassarchaeaceae archaeon]
MDGLDDLDTRLLVDLLRDHRDPRKSLGQHYLVDDQVIDRTMEIPGEFSEQPSSDSHILEVGPGPGSLTLALLRSHAKVTAIEIDEESVAHLERVFGNREKPLHIKVGDAVRENWPAGITHVISNLPYQISSPIIERITSYNESDGIKLAIILVQEEFAHRMAMSTPPYDIGPLGLSLWLDFDVTLDRKVPPSSFSPAPRVNSRLVVMKPVNREEANGIDKRLFRMITKHCFANRRRKLRTLLSKPPSRISRINGWHKDRWKKASSEILSTDSTILAGDWADMRPENLDPSDWLTIVSELSSK